MNVSLTEAIGQLNLRPGQAYRTTVDGHEVEVRMLDAASKEKTPEEPSPFADGVMVDLWLDIPDPPYVKIVVSTPGPADPFDPPVIPTDEEGAA